MDDSAMYTGLDGEIEGIFGNEAVEKETKQLLHDQDTQLKELTPKLQKLLDMIESERTMTLEFIAGYVDATKDSDELYRSELKAAGRYRTYLNVLKTKFTLALNETKKGKS